MRIREYDGARDREAVRRCFIELQDFERTLDDRLPPGESVADPYLSRMFERCREFDGVVLVAEVGNAIAGFVTVWTRYRSEEAQEDPTAQAYISDLVVSSPHRKKGIGRSLLRAAEAKARDAGSSCMRLTVLANNTAARALYQEAGFREYEILLEKRERR